MFVFFSLALGVWVFHLNKISLIVLVFVVSIVAHLCLRLRRQQRVKVGYMTHPPLDRR